MAREKKYPTPSSNKALGFDSEPLSESANEEKKDIILEKKTKNPALLARLEQLEREIIGRAKKQGFII